MTGVDLKLPVYTRKNNVDSWADRVYAAVMIPSAQNYWVLRTFIEGETENRRMLFVRDSWWLHYQRSLFE